MSDALRTSGFHHITLVTRDASRAHVFYAELLGLRAYATQWFGASAAPGTLIRVLESPESRHGVAGLGGVHHLALGVATPAAQLKWKRRLMDADVGVSGPYDRGWFHSIYFRDPDGQVVEIATRGPGYTKDEAADALGARIIMPDASQLNGHRNERAIAAMTHSAPVPVITSDMTLDGLHHITGLTDDVARAGEFYEAALGLRLVKRSVNQDDGRTPHWFWANYDGERVDPHSSLTMFGSWEARGVHARYHVGREGAGQTHSVAFRARDIDELHAWRDHVHTLARVRSLDLDVSDIEETAWFSAFSFRAPDGLHMQIATDGPGIVAVNTTER